MYHRGNRIIFGLVIVCLLYATGPRTALAGPPQEARVIRVNDGDTITIRMDDRTWRCRIIGLDAPEMGQEPWGEKAREHLRALLKGSRWRVFVETDAEKYDKYNRLLVYIRTPDNMFVNEKMLADGYAVLFTFPPNTRYVDLFIKAQRAAREKKLGIWGPDGLKERPVDYKKKHPRE